MVTQPLMYKKIAPHPGTRKLYADKLVTRGRARAPTKPRRWWRTYREALDAGTTRSTTR